jgi:hypothetical protein
MWRFVVAMTAALALPAYADPAPRSIAEIVMTEGLAMHRERALHPDKPGPDFAEAAAHRARILRDVSAVLNASDRETVERFTSSTGPSGIKGEACYTAWQVTSFWLAHGETLTEIARVKAADAPARVAEAIDLMLKEQR